MAIFMSPSINTVYFKSLKCKDLPVYASLEVLAHTGEINSLLTQECLGIPLEEPV